jgi:transcriptional regulator with XRE-family HTH domain
MTKKPDKTAPSDRLKAIADRLGLDDTRLAKYLGVSVSTLRHWTIGTREPAAVVDRLLDVLGMMEALAPSLHAQLLPSPAPKRGRPPTKPVAEHKESEL